MPKKSELAERMGHDAYAAMTGLEVLHVEPGRVDVRMPVTPGILNGHGNVHGGALFTLADYAAAAASNMLGTATMATNGSISYLRAVRGGHVLAKARTVKDGQRMKFQVVELFDEQDRLVAVFQGGAITVNRKQP